MLVSPGTRLGPYEILSPLGAGGMGEVYRARDTRLARDVAIKGLPAELAASPERLTRFRREAQTLASLNHPGIGAIYGLEEADGQPYLVLELVAGETLAARLARGPLPPREALALCLQIASAIEAAHERGVVHRDLKPGNIMVTTAGLAKVLDFGLAKLEPGPIVDADSSASPTLTNQGTATLAGALLGTAAYMSPEQARGKTVDRRTDVWAFGCVMFECFAGRPAFAGETVSDLIARILEREPDWASLPATTPSRVRELLRRCLRKDAEARSRDIRDVRVELADVVAGGAEAGASQEKSIAVLPFENLSGADDEYFADGVTDEILNALAHVDGLRVAARTSCFAFKGRREDLRLVGEKLDVSTVLEGTVRRSGTRLRITAQMVDVADGYQLWSERYEREMTDVFAIQDEIAGEIARRLRGALHHETERQRARRGTQDLQAYELLLRGRALQNKRGRFLHEAIACFERAIELDPSYAEALAWLSDSYRLMGTFGAGRFSDVMPKAESMARRALAIDPELAEAWTTLACVEEQYRRNYERAGELYDRALAADPRHARARMQRSLWAYVRGSASEAAALAEAERAMNDDPLNAWVGGMHSYLLGFMGRHEESIAMAARSLEIDPEAFFSQWNLMRGHAWAGHYTTAIELAPSVLKDSGRSQWALGTLAWCYGKVGDPIKARAVHDEVEGRSRHEFLSPWWLATSASAAGLEDEAMRFAALAVKEGDPLLIWGRISPFWDAVRGYRGFDQLVRGVW